MEPIIDYGMKDYLNDSTFKDVITQLVIGQCKENGISQSKTLKIVNRELMRNDYKSITLSAVKYHW